MSLAVNRGLDPHFPATPKSVVDRSFVVRRLSKNALSLLAAHPRTEYLGDDAAVTALAASQGFTAADLAILRISCGAARHTLVCVPERIWHSRKAGLLALKNRAVAAGRSCVLVPESTIQRQPRLSTARMIEEAMGVRVTPDDRMAIVIHLLENGGRSSLIECASALDHQVPFSAILHLVALGVVGIQPNRSLTPETPVFLPDALP